MIRDASYEHLRIRSKRMFRYNQVKTIARLIFIVKNVMLVYFHRTDNTFTVVMS